MLTQTRQPSALSLIIGGFMVGAGMFHFGLFI
jgi:hypothetical protein